jgi:hypothetical protein
MRILLLTVAVGLSTGAVAEDSGHAVRRALTQILRAADWRGAVDVVEQGACGVADGEFTFWVYATATICGVPREQADRLVLIRQPTLAVTPLKARTVIPGDRYAVWVYGSGQTGHPGVNLCGKGRSCVSGLLAQAPSWVFLGWIETRDEQLLILRSSEVPYGHRLVLQAVVLSSSEVKPDWAPQ